MFVSSLMCRRAFFPAASSRASLAISPLPYLPSVPLTPCCVLSTSSAASGSKEQHPKVSKNKFELEKTRKWIEKLPAEDRAYLLKSLAQSASPEQLQQLQSTLAAEDGGPTERPTNAQLYHLAFHNSLPFIGFGFLDNFIMIVAGDLIDHHIGVTFSISTMAAAALGNTISDVFGVGSAWYVEAMAAKLGASPPVLTQEQTDLSVARIAANVGRAVGVALGCIIGMLPLMFM